MLVSFAAEPNVLNTALNRLLENCPSLANGASAEINVAVVDDIRIWELKIECPDFWVGQDVLAESSHILEQALLTIGAVRLEIYVDDILCFLFVPLPSMIVLAVEDDIPQLESLETSIEGHPFDMSQATMNRPAELSAASVASASPNGAVLTDSQFFTLEEVAAACGDSADCIRELCVQQSIPVSTLGAESILSESAVVEIGGRWLWQKLMAKSPAKKAAKPAAKKTKSPAKKAAKPAAKKTKSPAKKAAKPAAKKTKSPAKKAVSGGKHLDQFRGFFAELKLSRAYATVIQDALEICASNGQRIGNLKTAIRQLNERGLAFIDALVELYPEGKQTTARTQLKRYGRRC